VSCAPTSSGRGCAAAAYERLRDHVLEGTTTGVFGLVVLMRGGVAAWLTGAATPAVAVTHAKDPLAATPLVSHDLHADMVSVLANMAMATSTEVHS
jgi:hypothetical protein